MTLDSSRSFVLVAEVKMGQVPPVHGTRPDENGSRWLPGNKSRAMAVDRMNTWDTG